MRPGRSAAQVDAHQQGDRDGQGDGGESPRAALERIDHHERDHRNENNHDAKHPEEGGVTGQRADLILHHLAQRFPVAAHGAEQGDEIVDRAAQHTSDDDPERPRQVAELRGQDGTHQRTRSGDGRKVMPEDHPLVRGNKVATVFEALGGRGALVVEQHDLGGDELAIEAIPGEKRAGGGEDQPDAVDGLVPAGCNGGQEERRGNRDSRPGDVAEHSLHSTDCIE